MNIIKTQKGNFSVFLLLNTEKSYSHLLHTENMYFFRIFNNFSISILDLIFYEYSNMMMTSQSMNEVVRMDWRDGPVFIGFRMTDCFLIMDKGWCYC